MAKVNKLALVRLALQQTLGALSTREKLCVLADLYVPPTRDGEKDDSVPRWYGNGHGTSGLEQGIYDHMTTFRRVSNLWTKIKALSPDIKKETYDVRDFLIKSLTDAQVDLGQIEDKPTDE